MGGKESNKHASRKTRAGRGVVGKTPVAGVKDRETNEVRERVVDSTDAPTLQGFVMDNTKDSATVYTDESSSYASLPMTHESVKHSLGEWVKGDAHTNGIESFWAMLKRGHKGHLPSNERQAPAPIREGVRGSSQRSETGHRGSAWKCGEKHAE